MKQSQKFAIAMRAVADDYEESNKVAASFDFKVGKLQEYGGRRGFRFNDGSVLFFGKEGVLLLPEKDAV